MVDALTAAYQRHLSVTRATVGDVVAQRWARLGTYDTADVPRFVDAVVPVISAGQARAVALTSAYLARKLGQAVVGLDIAALQGADIRNGTTPDEVYRRPFVEVWSALSDGAAWDDAVRMGGTMAKSSAVMDVALTTRDALVQFGQKSGIVAWRRVADPGCCDYCQAIDGAYTGPGEPQPLHNRCGCTAEPVMRHSGLRDFLTPGRTIGDATIHLHGELGPVIGAAGDHFAGPADIHAA